MLIKKPFKKGFGSSVAALYGGGGLPGPPTLTFQDRQDRFSGSGVGPWTWTLAVGTASANRRVYIILMGTDASNSLSGTPTIGGVTCDVVVALANTPSTSGWLLSAPVPSGTSTNLVATFANTLFSATLAYAWTTDSTTLVSSTPTATASFNASTSVTTLTGQVATSAGGAILMGFCGAGITGGSQTISTSDSSMVQATNFGQLTGGTSNNVLLSAANHVTVTWTTAASGSQMFLVALR